jgi:transcriptional regulator with XRE-family HTH domain
MIIGDRVRALRKTKNLSQGDVEKRTGLLRAYISRVENGETLPAIETLEKLARALDCPLYELFYDGKESTELPNRIPSWSRILHMLEVQGKLDQFEQRPLGKLVQAIVKEGSKQKSRKALQEWLEEYGESWLVEKRPALAAVIEAAAQLSLPGTDVFVARTLAYKQAEINVASIAAQRVRLFPIKDPKLRRELWESLKYWIELWVKKSETEEYAMLALPSVPIIAQKDAVEWLCNFLTNGSKKAAWSAALGVLEWAAAGRPVSAPDDKDADALSEALINRFHREVESPSSDEDGTSPLLPTIVWTLGATATERQISYVARILADSFRKPQSLEDAAALRAGKLLVRRWHEKGLQALTLAFGDNYADDFLRYNVGLLLMNR